MEKYLVNIRPVLNIHQYILVFVIASIFSAFVYFFSNRKYNSLKNNTNVFGFTPELAVYYRSLYKRGPFNTNSPDTSYAACNSIIMGMLISGVVAVSILLFVDLIMFLIQKKYSKTIIR